MPGKSGPGGAWYTEVESGKLADRPQLARSLSHAKRTKALLVVAKLDRLARNVEFVARVMNSSVDFVACDNPAANRLTLHILAAVAEAEAKAISDRTKTALAAAKARGTKLGSARPGHWEGREDARLAGARTEPSPRPRLGLGLPGKPMAICCQRWKQPRPKDFPCEPSPPS